MHVHPQGGKNIPGVIYRRKLLVHPQTEQQSNFQDILWWAQEIYGVGVVNLGVLRELYELLIRRNIIVVNSTAIFYSKVIIQS